MGKMLVDGERREIQPEPWSRHEFESTGVKVYARRVDSETPYIELHVATPEGVQVVHMSDVMADSLRKMIKRAMQVLPASK